MKLRKITQVRALGSKRVLVRCGFDVPLAKGKIKDNTRIKESLQTIEYLYKKGARVILMTHLGRPGGKPVAELSAKVVAQELSRLLQKRVYFVDDCIGEKVELAVKTLKEEEVLLLENLRFYRQERENGKAFAKKLAGLADMYVNEAFSNSHRRHASMVQVPRILPSYAGFHLAQEVAAIEKFFSQKKHPIVAVIGGVKISSKLGVIMRLLKKVDHVLLGGALANTALAAQGVLVGKSFIEHDMLKVLKKFPMTDSKLHIPVDVVVSQSLEKSRGLKIKAVGGKIGKSEFIVDIGPDTIKLYCNIIRQASTVFFAGPMGKFEVRAFAKGTKSVLSSAKKVNGYTIAGGGDTLHAVHTFRVSSYFDYLSSAGGAMLAMMEGKILPAIVVLKNR